MVFKENSCKFYHLEIGLIIQSNMSSNIMFMVKIEIILPTCFKTSTNKDLSMTWHNRYEYLSLKGLKLLSQKGMVKELLIVVETSRVCSDCLVGKQHMISFPKLSSWRATHKLQLIHADICGPIKPKSNSGTKYFITFIMITIGRLEFTF